MLHLQSQAPQHPWQRWESASPMSTLGSTLGMDAPLIAAVRRDDVAAVRATLQTDRQALLDRDGRGRTALHVAATLGHDRALQLLLAHGADALAETPSGFTALHYAAGRGSVACIRALAAMGCSPGVRTPDGVTPLHCAAANGRVAAVRYLLANGAPADAQDGGGMTPLAEATRHRHGECVALLRATIGLGARAADGEAWQAAGRRATGARDEGELQQLRVSYDELQQRKVPPLPSLPLPPFPSLSFPSLLHPPLADARRQPSAHAAVHRQGDRELLDTVREDALRDWHASVAR